MQVPFCIFVLYMYVASAGRAPTMIKEVTLKNTHPTINIGLTLRKGHVVINTEALCLCRNNSCYYGHFCVYVGKNLFRVTLNLLGWPMGWPIRLTSGWPGGLKRGTVLRGPQILMPDFDPHNPFPRRHVGFFLTKLFPICLSICAAAIQTCFLFPSAVQNPFRRLTGFFPKLIFLVSDSCRNMWIKFKININ